MAKTTCTWNGVERRRVEKVVETLATLRSRGQNLSEVAHDARNMVTALALYCDLLEEPGVLERGYAHYAQELRLVAAASRRLVEKLVALDTNTVPDGVLKSLLQANAGRRAALAGAEGLSSAADTSSAAAAFRSRLPAPETAPGKVPNRARAQTGQALKTGTGTGICCPLYRSRTWLPSCWPTAICWRRWPGPRWH
jgi:hypothetical protein